MNGRRRKRSVLRVIFTYFVFRRWGDNARHNTLDGMEYATRPVPLETYRDTVYDSYTVRPVRKQPPVTYRPGELRPYVYVNLIRLCRFISTYRIYVLTTCLLLLSAVINIRFVDSSKLPTRRHLQRDVSLAKQHDLARSRGFFHGARSTYLTFQSYRESRRMIHFHDDASEMYHAEAELIRRERSKLRTLCLNDTPRLTESDAKAIAEQERAERQLSLLRRETKMAREARCWMQSHELIRANDRRIQELEEELSSFSISLPNPSDAEDPNQLARVLAEDPHSLSSRELSILWDYYSQDANTLPRFHSWACCFQIYRLALPTIKLPAGLGLYLSPVPVCLMYLLFLRLGHDLRPSFFTRRVIQPSRRLLSKSVALGRLLFR